MSQPVKDKKIMMDDDKVITAIDSEAGRAAERSKFKTPDAMRELWEKSKKDNGLSKLTITPSNRPFKEWARVEIVSATFSDKEMVLKIEVYCNPSYMCEPHDLVPVYLEQQTDKLLFMIALLEPTEESNVHTIDFTYPLRDLAAKLGVTVVPRQSPLDALKEHVPQLGVTAQWLADTKGQGNHPNHVSGGVFEKGGSGKILIRARTSKDFKDSETVRNTEWNMAERLTEDRHRPVFDAFSTILANGKEMATTLEAESEYEVDDAGTIEMITKKLNAVTVKVTEARKRAGSANGPAKVDFPYDIVEMSKSEKVYTDHYFDLVVPGSDRPCPLLANGVVLRRRTVDSDPAGTYLVSVKGRTVEKDGERIRLAAQINLNEVIMGKGEGLVMLAQLLRDESNVDNAFARVLWDAVGRDHGDVLGDVLRGDFTLKHVLTVVSTRVKYGMKFDDSTVVEFSADSADGTRTDGLGGKKTVYSFEFGVGHPGLTAGNTPTAMSMARLIAQFDSTDGVVPTPGGAVKVEPERRPITRPYHVPADLESKRLFQKSDYKKYMKLRDDLIRSEFGLNKRNLRKGGNKAAVLAKQLELL